MSIISRGQIEITLGPKDRKRAPRAIREAVLQGIEDGAKKAIPTIKKFTPTRTRRLIDSYKTRINRSRFKVTIFSPLRYAKMMEFGRRPGARMPPVRKLIPWVRERHGLSGKAARRRAWALAKHIQKFGIRIAPDVGLQNEWNRGKGRMFERAFRKLKPKFFANVIARALKKAERKFR